MKLCAKHQTYLDSKIPQEFQLIILSEYNDVLDIVSYQEKIEYRKNKCQICFFGASGKTTLEKIIKKKEKENLIKH